MRSQFSLAVAIPFQHFFGADDPHRLRVVDGKRQAIGIPKLDVVGLMIPLFGEGRIGC